ncbi:MAG: hypothetical protein CVU65_05655 [Deltaproteobacteria bacterium HGW-Deltaproteobacteria-22]|nr:MAG: hypothetical protein CVU65_05655 [Deltaproteobacteria bacterium HGW-Deltaproteobacteria-22]
MTRFDPMAMAAHAKRETSLAVRLLGALAAPPEIRSPGAIAESLQLTSECVDAELAAVLINPAFRRRGAVDHALGGQILRRHRSGWSMGPAGVWEKLRAPNPFDIEDWIEDQAWASLDEALSAVGLKAPRAAAGAPDTFWRDGTRLSAGARGWYLTHLLAGEVSYRQTDDSHAHLPVASAAQLLDPALSIECRLALAGWLVHPPGKSKPRGVVPAGDDVIDWLGEEVESGRLDRRSAVSLRGFSGRQAQRWWYRWIQLNGIREVTSSLSTTTSMLVFQDRLMDGLWPSHDDPTGTVGQWRAWVIASLQRAMSWQEPWSAGRFLATHGRHPLVRPLVEGLVFETEAGKVILVDGAFMDAAGHAPVAGGPVMTLRVAHPAQGLDGWPTPHAPPPFDQSGWPVFDVADLPPLPTEPIPHVTWMTRCRSLGLAGVTGVGGGTQGEVILVKPFSLEVRHRGYGSGHGGRRPVEDLRFAVRKGIGDPLARFGPEGHAGWLSLPQWLRSEAIRMLRMLFGIDPLPDQAAPSEDSKTL